MITKIILEMLTVTVLYTCGKILLVTMMPSLLIPSCSLLQWTVNGLLRIGFFTQRHITAGTELTFDYKLQRYGYVHLNCNKTCSQL